MPDVIGRIRNRMAVWLFETLATWPFRRAHEQDHMDAAIWQGQQLLRERGGSDGT